MPFKELPFLKEVFTSWAEPITEALDLIETDLDMFAFISNYVVANCHNRHRDFNASRKLVGEEYTDGKKEASIEIMFSTQEMSWGVWNHVWLRGGVITWHQNTYKGSQLTGAEEIKAFIRSLHGIEA